MAGLDDLFSRIPVAELAQKFGIDETLAHSAVRDAVPALLDGMGVNASHPDGVVSLENALGQHADRFPDSSMRLADVDENEGSKIVNKVFGSNNDHVVSALDSKHGVNIFGALLPVLAPMVIAFVAKLFHNRNADAGQAQAGQAQAGQTQPGQGGGIGDLLGGLLGGAGAIGGLGGILGGLLGGHAQGSNAQDANAQASNAQEQQTGTTPAGFPGSDALNSGAAPQKMGGLGSFLSKIFGNK